MINLLPPRDKQEVKREVIFRKVLAVFSSHFICLLILVLVLGFLSAFLASKAESFQEALAQKEQQFQSERFRTLKNDAVSLNSSLNKLQIFWKNQIKVSSFLERFIPLTFLDPYHLYLRNLSFRLSSKKSTVTGASATSTNAVPLIFAAIHLEGTVDSREGLYEFKKVLERQNDFQPKPVIFSSYSWSRAKYPDFSLDINFIPINNQ